MKIQKIERKDISFKEALAILNSEENDFSLVASARLAVANTVANLQGLIDKADMFLKDPSAFDTAYPGVEGAVQIINGNEAVKIQKSTKKTIDIDIDSLDRMTIPAECIETRVVYNHKVIAELYKKGITDGNIAEACSESEKTSVTMSVVDPATGKRVKK